MLPRKLLSRFMIDPELPLPEFAVEPDPEEVPEPEPELCIDEVPEPEPELWVEPEPEVCDEVWFEVCEVVVVRLVRLLLLSPPPNSRSFPPSTKKAITATTISSSFPLHPPRPMPAGTPPRRLCPECCVPPVREVEGRVEPVAGREAEGREAPCEACPKTPPVAGREAEGRVPCAPPCAFCAA